MQSPSAFLYMTLLIGISCSSTKEARQAARDDIRSAVTAQEYTFKANNAESARGRNRMLTSEYDLRVSKDTIVAYLPYFGRAYSAPMDPSSGGIKFTSVDFSYSLTERPKGGWEVLIKPNDAKDVQQLFLTISENGYGSLQATGTNRQPISFTGQIERNK